MKTEIRKHFKLREHNKISEFVEYSYYNIESLVLNIPMGRIVILQPWFLPNDWEEAKLSKKKKAEEENKHLVCAFKIHLLKSNHRVMALGSKDNKVMEAEHLWMELVLLKKRY
jgi:hypothetical protein